MPKRTGLPTLTDERRKWDAKRLLSHYSRGRPQPAVESWRKAFPLSDANDNSARVMWGDRVRWFRENFPEEMREFEWSLCPDWMLRSSGVERPPRRQPPRGRTEREKRTILRASRIIIAYCVMRLPLDACWRMADPASPANPNSARILAQRTANNFIRKYPGAAQVIIENLSRTQSAMIRRQSSRK